MKNVIIASILPFMAISCQEPLSSESKNIFDELPPEVEEMNLTESSILGESILYSHSFSGYEAYKLNLKSDKTGIITTASGTSTVSWNLQQGRLNLKVKNLSSSIAEHTPEGEITGKSKTVQIVISSTKVDGKVQYKLISHNIITWDDDARKPSFREHLSEKLKFTNSKKDWSQFLFSGQKLSIDLGRHSMSALVIGDEIMDTETGLMIPYTIDKTLDLSIEGQTYSFNLLHFKDGVAATALELNDGSDNPNIRMANLVEKTFDDVLTMKALLAFIRLLIIIPIPSRAMVCSR